MGAAPLPLLVTTYASSMSSLWTPEGEHRVPRPGEGESGTGGASDAGAPGSPGAPGSSGSSPKPPTRRRADGDVDAASEQETETEEELLEYLRCEGRYAGPDCAPQPGLVLLDLNMPRKDGREALREIKSDPRLRRIPIVVLTTSRAEEDILNTYDLGVNSFCTKPVTFDGLVTLMKTMACYWFQIVELPPTEAAPASTLAARSLAAQGCR